MNAVKDEWVKLAGGAPQLVGAASLHEQRPSPPNAAAALAAFGIYGVMSYHVALRRQEMGVRQALGARPQDLLADVIGQSLRFLALGTLVGVVAALALGRLIESLLFGVAATDPLSFLAAFCALAFSVVLASFLPALRAARSNPLTALSSDRR